MIGTQNRLVTDTGRKQSLACVVGARPNFMKIAPLLHALEKYPQVHPVLIHTGQHYDTALSDVFFQELAIKAPDVTLNVGSGSHGQQTARVLERMEEILQQGAPGGNSYDRVIVVGDVNSTMAAALAAVKLGIPVTHVEAGLRSFDRTMPEEINRIVTDSISNQLFISEPAGVENLLREGHPPENLHLVGNVMIDTLLRLLPIARQGTSVQDLELQPDSYGFITMHRPANVDSPGILSRIIATLIELAADLPLVFAVHPRTRGHLERSGLLEKLNAVKEIRVVPPLGYLDCLCLTSQAKLIITDSGGLQEESTVLRIPCLTMRPNTERPITVDQGTSTLMGSDAELLRHSLKQILSGAYKPGTVPQLWDGHAAERIAAILANGHC